MTNSRFKWGHFPSFGHKQAFSSKVSQLPNEDRLLCVDDLFWQVVNVTLRYLFVIEKSCKNFSDEQISLLVSADAPLPLYLRPKQTPCWRSLVSTP